MDKLKKRKVYVPTHEILKDGWVNLYNKTGGKILQVSVQEKELYTFDKEDLINLLETVYSQGISDGVGNYSERNNNYINSLLS